MKVDVGLVAERQATVNDKITRVAVTETGSILITNTPSLNSDTAKPDITPPQGPRPQVPEAEPTWSPDELDALASLAHHFQNNHEIIASALAGMHVGSAPRKRTPWQCYDQLCLQRVHAHPAKPKTGYLFAPPSRSSKARLADNKTKALRLLTFFDQVKKCARKRDLSRANQQKQQLQSKNTVNLSAHETHEQSQTMIGIDPHGRFLDPTELGVLKERRDRMVIEQQRSAMMAGQMRTTAGVAGAGPSPQGLASVQQQQFRQMQRQGNVNANGRGLAQFTPEQLHAILSRQYMHQGQTQNMQSVPNTPPSNGGNFPQRMQNDLSTAAAYVALTNAQNAAKVQQGNQHAGVAKGQPGVKSATPASRKRPPASGRKPPGPKPDPKTTKKPPARPRKRRVQDLDSDEDEEDESDETDEEELSPTDSESSRPLVRQTTKRTTAALAAQRHSVTPPKPAPKAAARPRRKSAAPRSRKNARGKKDTTDVSSNESMDVDSPEDDQFASDTEQEHDQPADNDDAKHVDDSVEAKIEQDEEDEIEDEQPVVVNRRQRPRSQSRK